MHGWRHKNLTTVWLRQTNHSMHYFFESNVHVWNNGACELFNTILSNLFCNLRASVAQNVREDPQCAPWNDSNNTNNTELEGGQQNTMGCSTIGRLFMNTLLASKAEKISSLYQINSGVSLTTKPANQQRNTCTSKRYHVDPIQFIALPYFKVKLACSVFTYMYAKLKQF